MPRRILILFALMSLPEIAFAILYRRPVFLAALPLSAGAALWVASPVTYPTWLRRGLVAACVFDAVLLAALWLLSR